VLVVNVILINLIRCAKSCQFQTDVFLQYCFYISSSNILTIYNTGAPIIVKIYLFN
jgi:hypothetical protein